MNAKLTIAAVHRKTLLPQRHALQQASWKTQVPDPLSLQQNNNYQINTLCRLGCLLTGGPASM
jgi:hypothetical protein